MTEELQLCIDVTKEGMSNVISHMERELHKIRAGKASPDMLENIKINYYGTVTPLNQAANINTPDPRTIVIQPWDKSIISEIEKAIMAANLGFTPRSDGELIRINVPPLSEERRREMVKKVKTEGENSKISVRNIRRTSNEEVKGLQKKGIPEDEIKKAEKEIQDLTNWYIDKIDKILEAKEKEILTV